MTGVSRDGMAGSFMFLALGAIIMACGLTWINWMPSKAKVVCPAESVYAATMTTADEKPPVVVDGNNNTYLWTAVISTLGMAFITAVSSIVNNIINLKIKMKQMELDAKVSRTEDKVDENTRITKESAESTKAVVSLADASNH